MRSVDRPSSAFPVSFVIAAAIGATIVLTPVAASAAEDTACLQQAVTNRSKDLTDAYKRYADDMNNAVKRMTDDENADLKSGSVHPSASAARAVGSFVYSTNSVWQALTMNLFTGWDRYNRARASCSGLQVPFAPPSYGGYNYGSPYGYGINAYCTQPVLTAPPAGCSYECAQDSNGCQRCHLACRTAVSYSSCGCPPTYDPVCTRDNRTYDNACIAICEGRQVWYDGACR